MRVSNRAPTTASNVFPNTIPVAVKTVLFDVVKLASKAATATAGHIRYPNYRMAASAIPVGGQTSVTCWAV